MGNKYDQFTREDRQVYASLLKRRTKSGKKLSQKEIAADMGFSTRTLRREKERGVLAGREYNAVDAQQKKHMRKKRSKYLGMKIDNDEKLNTFVVSGLKGKQRPETIAGRLKHFHGPDSAEPIKYVSSKTIYSWLRSPQGQQYVHLIPSGRYRLKKHKVNKTARVLIPERVSHTKRPLGALNRTRYGHTSSDTMVSGRKTGSKTSVAGTVERKMRYAELTLIPNLKPTTMNEGLTHNFTNMGIALYTDTKDNGIENAGHKAVEADLGVKSYFCDPYSPWQKGEIEHIFKLVRAEGVPKGADLSLLTPERLQAIQDTINGRWRRSLGYYSPTELMTKRRAHEAKKRAKQKAKQQNGNPEETNIKIRTADAVRYTTLKPLTSTKQKRTVGGKI